MKSAITLCQVPEALAGPFVLRTPLPEAFASAAALLELVLDTSAELKGTRIYIYIYIYIMFKNCLNYKFV